MSRFDDNFDAINSGIESFEEESRRELDENFFKRTPSSFFAFFEELPKGDITNIMMHGEPPISPSRIWERGLAEVTKSDGTKYSVRWYDYDNFTIC